MQRPLIRTTVAAAILAVFAGGAWTLSNHEARAQIGRADPVVVAAADTNASAALSSAVSTPTGTAPIARARAVSLDFSPIVETYGPAVVNISVTGKADSDEAQAASQQIPGMSPDDPFYQFFRQFGGPQFRRGPQQGAPMVRGEGSGFIVSADGIILTNAHVVDKAQVVTVKLTDRREFRAKVLGVDKMTDVAVIKIEAKDLPTVRLGNPSQTKVGEPVLAIGSPFGFENTATSGIVSAKGRALPDDNYVPFIQTDVAVNPGNSGGPLFNEEGEVIGINSQIYTRSGGYQGLSFAIPIDVATKVQQQLVAHGKVVRSRLGISIQEVNQSLAEAFGLKRPMGALVSAVESGGPADKAGVQIGDVIVGLDGTSIDQSFDLPTRVSSLKPGTAVKIDVIRKGEPKTLTASVVELNPTKVAAADEQGADQGRLGLAVRPLQPEERRESGLKSGLVVQQAGGPAARAGLQAGDVILSCNGSPVSSVEQLRALVGKANKHVALLIQRDDAQIFVPVDLG